MSKTASRIAAYLSITSQPISAVRRDRVVDILGHIQPNFDNAPHLLIDLLFTMGNIGRIRHIPTESSYPSTAFAIPRATKSNVVVVNDWLAPPRAVHLFGTGRNVPNVIYHFEGYENVEEPHFVNTIIKGAKVVIYNFSSKWNRSAVNHGSRTDLAPIHHLVRHAARYLSSKASIVIIGAPYPHWFDPNGETRQPVRHPALSPDIYIPPAHRKFTQLLLYECDRNGIDSPLKRITFVSGKGASKP